ncbi:MAG TPA: serine hydrolase domain-containing protein [Chthoniobacterales bacterium]
MKRALSILLLLAAVAPSHGMESAASSLRLPDSRIAAAAAYSRKHGGLALIVQQAGKTLHESYASGVTPDNTFLVMSITKNLAALATFAARSQGILTFDEPVARTIPEWRGDSGKSTLTIRNLLEQTSGLASGYNTIYARGVRDKNRLAISLPLVNEPGARFAYAPGNYELLEEILRRKLSSRRTDPLSYLAAKVLVPLGIPAVAAWRRDGRGNPFFSAGARLTARDLAKIGRLVGAPGRAVPGSALPPAAFAGAFAGSPANSMYGLSFWLNANAAAPDARALSIEGTLGESRSPADWRTCCISPAAPADLIAMVGSGGQRCYVVPSRKLVVVRLGNGSSFSDAEFLRRLFEHG